MIHAIAHVRGGDDLGREWYPAGKTDRRKNPFNDFIDVAKGLIATGYPRVGDITTEGRSAGGQARGAVDPAAQDLRGVGRAGAPLSDGSNNMLWTDLQLAQ